MSHDAAIPQPHSETEAMTDSMAANAIAAAPVDATPVDATPVAAGDVAASPVAASPVAASPVAASPVAASPAGASPAGASPAVATLAVPRRNLRAGLARTLRRLLRVGVTLAFFAVGAYLGWQSFLGNQPATQVVTDPAVAGVPTPAIVQELATAIGNDDADAIRAALDPAIFSAYTADLQSFGITSVDGVDTLGTYGDGARSATELVIHGRDADKNPFSVNLIVLVENGQIVRLR